MLKNKSNSTIKNLNTSNSNSISQYNIKMNKLNSKINNNFVNFVFIIITNIQMAADTDKHTIRHANTRHSTEYANCTLFLQYSV